MALANIEIDQIEVGSRLRDISEAQVETLIASIGDIGLLNPITVYPRQIIQSGLGVDGYGLVAGAHRLEACKRLGLVDIAAHVVDLSDLERQIAECDENLCSTVLSGAERAMFTKRRKQAYEALHPETMNGGDRKSDQFAKLANRSDADRFTLDTARKTGKPERAVQRDAERGKKISERALSMVKGSPLDTGTYLDALKAIDDLSAQLAKVKRDLAAGRPELSVEEQEDRQSKALHRAWLNAAPHVQEKFLQDIGCISDLEAAQ